jgi:hypothetical protein
VHPAAIVTVSESGEAIKIDRRGGSHFRLDKAAKKVPTHYLEGDLERLRKEAWDLLGELVDFATALKAEKVAAATAE